MSEIRSCLYCGQPLTFTPGKGWLHPDGRLIVTKFVTVYDCTDCGHQFRSSEVEGACPQCGELNMEERRIEERDDHIGTPNYQTAVRR